MDIQLIEQTIDPTIKGYSNLSHVDEPAKIEKVQEFYNAIIEAHLKYSNLGEGEKCDPKKGFNTFLDYLRTYLYEEKNTRFKVDTKTNVVVLSKRYYEKEGFTLSFCSKTFKILDFKHSLIKRTEDGTTEEYDVESEETFKDIISIEKNKDGTNIILVIQNGVIITVRTSGTFNAETSYDSTETHYDLFFKTLDEVGFGLSKFFDISKTNPKTRFCFNFLMKLNFTPFPTVFKNEIHLISAYEIKDKEEEFQLFNTQLEALPTSDFEEKREELQEFVKTELTLSYINYYKSDDVVSFLYNIGCGIIQGPQYYVIPTGVDIKSFITDILTKQNASQGEKGIIIKYSDGIHQEIINDQYQYICDLRSSCSMVITPENERKLFYELFLKLLFTKKDEGERTKLFQDFYKYYDSDTRLDGKGGKYNALFKKFYEAINTYSNNIYDLYRKNRIQTILPHERFEIDKDIPISCRFKGDNAVNITHRYYQSKREKESPNIRKKDQFKIELQDVIVGVVFETILKSKYDSFMSDDYQLKFKDNYGDIYGKIMTPL